MQTAAADIKEMLAAWNAIEATMRERNPGASAEDIYQATARAMRATLGL